MRYKMYIWLLLLVFISCEYELEWSIEPSENNVVIDAIITDEYKYQQISIMNCNGELNGACAPVSGVDILLTNGIDSVVFAENNDSLGVYNSVVQYSAYGGNPYQLILQYIDMHDTATANMGALDKMDALAIVEYDSLLYRINYINSSIPSMTEVYYNWKENLDYVQEKGYTEASQTFYTLKTLDIIKEFAPKKEIIAFPRGTTIIRKKYSLSEVHQQFIRSLLIETEWRGGIFDVEQGNIPSSFHYGIVGWFGVCKVFSDTTVFD